MLVAVAILVGLLAASCSTGEPADEMQSIIALTADAAPDTEPPKDTIPLAEDETSPLEAFRSTREAFSECLSDDGLEFLGNPGADSDTAEPVDQPGYVEAVQRCSVQSGIAEAVEEFAASRAALTPEQILENNERVLALYECLRVKGWEIENPLPDETGALRPGALFRNPDGESNRADIRTCASEVNMGSGRR